MRVCVIGAGAAGLCAIKHAVSFGCDVTAFEQSDVIGGTWVYTDDVGQDKFGNPIHSSMYKSLQTNLPKELMEFPDLEFPPNEKSFIPADEVISYLNRYADTFNLRRFITFERQVIRARPLSDDKWEIIVKDLPANSYETLTFDALLLCNGHYNTAYIPRFKNVNFFRGRIFHSHDYKTPNSFSNKRVLVIGAGPSGKDITQELAGVADKIFWSHHSNQPKKVSASNIVQKSDVEQFTEVGAGFKDGSVETFDEVIFCTGYKYTFPFLSVDAGLATDDNYLRPLYKHCISINAPTMAIIGIPNHVCLFQMFDLQIRFFLTFLTLRKHLPSKEEMLYDTEIDMNRQWARGLVKSKAHSMDVGYQEIYFADLATTAGIQPMKPVLFKIYNENRHNQEFHFENYRKFRFTILDDESYESKLELN